MMSIYSKGSDDVMRVCQQLNLNNWVGLIVRATSIYVDDQDEMDWNFVQSKIDPLVIFYQLNKIPSKEERKDLNLPAVTLEKIADILETHPKPLTARIEKGSKLLKIEESGSLSQRNLHIKFSYRENDSSKDYSGFQELNQENFLRALGFRTHLNTISSFVYFRELEIIKALVGQKKYKSKGDFVYEAIREKLEKEIQLMDKDLFKKLDKDVSEVEKIKDKYGLK